MILGNTIGCVAAFIVSKEILFPKSRSPPSHYSVSHSTFGDTPLIQGKKKLSSYRRSNYYQSYTVLGYIKGKSIIDVVARARETRDGFCLLSLWERSLSSTLDTPISNAFVTMRRPPDEQRRLCLGGDGRTLINFAQTDTNNGICRREGENDKPCGGKFMIVNHKCH